MKLIEFLIKPYLVRYHELLRRVQNLEIITDTLLLDNEWIDEPSKYFNGQEKRQEILKEIISNFAISEVIETGTFIGRSTGFFASLLPNASIRSSELSPQFYTLAKQRLQKFTNIELYCMDSRLFLHGLPEANQGISFIYLDAHWHSDLPLKEELEILASKRPNSIIIIDDFQVRGDEGYNYDDYGKGKRLAFSDYDIVFKKLGYVAYAPLASSAEETGRKRGCVILTLEKSVISLDNLKSLKRA